MPEKVFRIVESGQTFTECNYPRGWETISNDEARGYIWLFEAPVHNATYVVGVDPAMGIPGWDRTVRMDDATKDNSAIEVFRIGKKEVEVEDEAGKKKLMSIPVDYQVAEYAGPVDFENTAAMVNALGRLYRGNGRMGVAHTIIEIYPGPGWMVEKQLISKYGYLNFYQPKYVNTLMPTIAGKGIGWSASRQSVQDLWVLGSRRIGNKNVVIRSPWLWDEMRTTDPRFFGQMAEARPGFHDDRLRAMMLSLWAAHDFSAQIRVETETTIEKNARPVSWQMSDMSATTLKDEMERRFREIGES
jgi:hypothetical protein